MLFHFLKYLQPTHYFQLYRKNGSSVFPVVGELPKKIIKQLNLDERYSSDVAKEYDLSWQAIQKGYIGKASTYTSFKKLPVVDEYLFLRKYFHPVWVFYVLLLRLVTFKNPFREIKGWKKSGNVQRTNYLTPAIKHLAWGTFQSSLIAKNPLVTVVIPTLNRYQYLKDVLEDLEKQTYSNIEVIVVDQSTPFQKDFYENFALEIELIHQEEKALWLARNLAIEASKGEYILLFDDDSRVENDWVINHLKCLDFFNAAISSGVSISKQGAEVPQHYSFFRVSSQLDTGNVLLKKDVFKTIGLFDRQFEKQRMGDGEFGLRAYLEGYLNISNPYAGRLHLKVGSGGLREMGSWDAFRPKKWLAPRPIPSVLYLFRKYHGKRRAVLTLLKTVPPSVMPYRFKKNRKLMLLGVLISLFLFPIILIQVGISWRKASKKLKQGPKIRELT